MNPSGTRQRSRSRPLRPKLLRDCRHKTARQRLMQMLDAKRRRGYQLNRAWKYRAPMFPEEYQAMMAELSPEEREFLGFETNPPASPSGGGPAIPSNT